MRTLAILALGLVAAAPAVSAQVIHGNLLDANSRVPLTEGVVTLLHDDTAVVQVRTDTAGAFTLRIPRRGSYRLRAEQPSYRAATSPAIGLGAQDTVEVEFTLAMDIVVLDPLVVRARTRRLTPMARRFYERKERGVWGTFITRQEIEKYRPIRTTDLFHRIPGVQTSPMMGGQSVTIRGTCRPTVFVDGVRISYYRSIDDLAQPLDIEGLEVYRSSAQAPPEYTGIRAGCATVLIWTRIE